MLRDLLYQPYLDDLLKNLNLSKHADVLRATGFTPSRAYRKLATALDLVNVVGMNPIEARVLQDAVGPRMMRVLSRFPVTTSCFAQFFTWGSRPMANILERRGVSRMGGDAKFYTVG